MPDWSQDLRSRLVDLRLGCSESLFGVFSVIAMLRSRARQRGGGSRDEGASHTALREQRWRSARVRLRDRAADCCWRLRERDPGQEGNSR